MTEPDERILIKCDTKRVRRTTYFATPDEVATAIKLHADGVPVYEISKMLERDQSSIYNWLRKNGVRLRQINLATRYTKDGMRICTRCKTPKVKNEFSSVKAASDGLHSYCGECVRTIQKTCHKNRKERLGANHIADQKKNAKLRRLFGIGLNEYNKMLATQGGLCAICRGPGNIGGRLVLDHCHKTGKVRGLLCDFCNLTLGYIGDSIQRLNAMENYLTIHGVGTNE